LTIRTLREIRFQFAQNWRFIPPIGVMIVISDPANKTYDYTPREQRIWRRAIPGR